MSTNQQNELKAKEHSSYGAFTIIAVLLPLVGMLLGIIHLSKSDPLEKKLGEHALALSIAMSFAWILLFAVLLF